MGSPIRITSEELAEIIALRERFRSDCKVAFGTNEDGEIWAWTNYGYHKKRQRIPVNGCSKLLERIAGTYVELSRDIKMMTGGRFFIDNDHAYWKDEQGSKHPILAWQLDTPKPKNIDFQTALNNLRNFRILQKK